MTSKDELAIKNTSIWLAESPLQHRMINHNTFRITDRTVGVKRFDIDVSIDQNRVSCGTVIVPPLIGPSSGRAAVYEKALRNNLSMFKDGSIGLQKNYSVDEHTPKKFFTTLGEFARYIGEVGPKLYKEAATRNLKFKK